MDDVFLSSRMHPECYQAMKLYFSENPFEDSFDEGMMARGLPCDYSEAQKEQSC